MRLAPDMQCWCNWDDTERIKYIRILKMLNKDHQKPSCLHFFFVSVHRHVGRSLSIWESLEVFLGPSSKILLEPRYPGLKGINKLWSGGGKWRNSCSKLLLGKTFNFDINFAPKVATIIHCQVERNSRGTRITNT